MAPVRRAATAAVTLLLLAGPVAAQSPALVLEGKVKQPQHWTLDDLKKMSATNADVSFQGKHGVVTGHFTGVLLWALIEAAGGIDDSGKSAELRHAIRVTAKDNYVVVTSTGEIAPEFGAKAAIVAYQRDGKPLDDFRLIMPGDKRGGRNVRDVTSINIE